MKIGDYIRKYREEHDMSGRAFANLVGVSVQHESNLERGVNNEGKPLKLSLPMVALIADATGIGQIDLLLNSARFFSWSRISLLPRCNRRESSYKI